MPFYTYKITTHQMPWQLHLGIASPDGECCPSQRAGCGALCRPHTLWPSASDRPQPPYKDSTRHRRLPPPEITAHIYRVVTLKKRVPWFKAWLFIHNFIVNVDKSKDGAIMEGERYLIYMQKRILWRLSIY